MQRRTIVICGIVQRGGFRPFVYRLATQLGLSGFVRNRAGIVYIEIEGEAAALDRFQADLSGQPPPLAQIEHISWEELTPKGERQFRIETSEADADSLVFLSPDVAICPELGGIARLQRPALSLSFSHLH